MSGNFLGSGGDQVNSYLIIQDEYGNPKWWDGTVKTEQNVVLIRPTSFDHRVHQYGSKGSGAGEIVSYTVPENQVFNLQMWWATGDSGEIIVYKNNGGEGDPDVEVHRILNSSQVPHFGITYPDNTPRSFTAGQIVKLWKNTVNGTLYGELVGFLEDV